MFPSMQKIEKWDGYIDWSRAECKKLRLPTTLFYDEEKIGFCKKICLRCPIIDQCLAYAVDVGEHGVWGGTSTKERKAIRRRRLYRYNEPLERIVAVMREYLYRKGFVDYEYKVG
jgi:hypothetical protein